MKRILEYIIAFIPFGFWLSLIYIFFFRLTAWENGPEYAMEHATEFFVMVELSQAIIFGFAIAAAANEWAKSKSSTHVAVVVTVYLLFSCLSPLVWVISKNLKSKYE